MIEVILQVSVWGGEMTNKWHWDYLLIIFSKGKLDSYLIAFTKINFLCDKGKL